MVYDPMTFRNKYSAVTARRLRELGFVLVIKHLGVWKAPDLDAMAKLRDEIEFAPPPDEIEFAPPPVSQICGGHGRRVIRRGEFPGQHM